MTPGTLVLLFIQWKLADPCFSFYVTEHLRAELPELEKNKIKITKMDIYAIFGIFL